eukprot:721198-Hanusia_phi.AAC.3
MTTSHTEATGPEFGAWRYYVDGWSVGFAPSPDISLNSADTWNWNSGDCQYRLSWHMNSGGWRAGCTTGLNSNNQWRKQIYSCPQTWSCRPKQATNCLLTASWDDIVQELSSRSGKYIAGGMGALMEKGAKETWLCQYGHECAPAGDAMCFVYNEQTMAFEAWDLLSVLQLV